MKQRKLQPETETPEAWAEAVKKSVGMDLVEENYEEIIKALETMPV